MRVQKRPSGVLPFMLKCEQPDLPHIPRGAPKHLKIWRILMSTLMFNMRVVFLHCVPDIQNSQLSNCAFFNLVIAKNAGQIRSLLCGTIFARTFQTKHWTVLSTAQENLMYRFQSLISCISFGASLSGSRGDAYWTWARAAQGNDHEPEKSDYRKCQGELPK